jgi:hypothetical protein
MCGGPTVFNLFLQLALTLLAELTVSCASFYILAGYASHLFFVPCPSVLFSSFLFSSDHFLAQSAQRGDRYLFNQRMYGAPPTV